MDYLDPKKKQTHKTRILFGYGLFAIAIALATVLLVYVANGYFIDRSTGYVIQNGLVYIDSKPGGAEVYLNGEKQRGQTDVRLVIPDGVYDIGLQREGYRNWQRSLVLEGGSLRRLTYARLIPDVLTPAPVASLRSNPAAVSQSIDKRWLVTSYADNPLNLTLIDLEQAAIGPVELVIPSSLVADPLGGEFEVVEWSDDNRNFLATYTVGASKEYLLVDRENPELAQNLNIVFADKALEFNLQDRKKDRFFTYSPVERVLSTASLKDGLRSGPLLSNVIDYTAFGNDWVLYVTDSDKEGLVEVRFLRGDKDILLKHIRTADNYLLQLAKLGNAPIMGFSSPVENRAIIYNDPQAYLNKFPNSDIPVATTVLRAEDPLDLRISTDSSVIMVYGSKNFASHEFDADRSYTFKTNLPMDQVQELRWLDGQHFLFSSGDAQVMMDFDGSNQYKLVNSIPRAGSYFSEDVGRMYSFTPAVLGADGSPASPAQMLSTELLIEADR